MTGFSDAEDLAQAIHDAHCFLAAVNPLTSAMPEEESVWEIQQKVGQAPQDSLERMAKAMGLDSRVLREMILRYMGSHPELTDTRTRLAFGMGMWTGFTVGVATERRLTVDDAGEWASSSESDNDTKGGG